MTKTKPNTFLHNMNKAKGSGNLLYVECINPQKMKYRVRWDFKTSYDENNNEDGVEFWEEEFVGPISMNAVKEIVLAGYNAKIDEAIRGGFVWNDVNVWLSAENQFNYKAAYDLAIQTEGATLPVTFKFGTDEEPVYHEFTSVSDLQDFYSSALAYIQNTLSEGWAAKNAIDWEPYENDIIYHNPLSPSYRPE